MEKIDLGGSLLDFSRDLVREPLINSLNCSIWRLLLDSFRNSLAYSLNDARMNLVEYLIENYLRTGLLEWKK